jgi:excisionase family DNA binding protein
VRDSLTFSPPAPIAPEPGDFLTVSETAKRLNVKPVTIRSWITQGRLTAKKFGRSVRIHRSELARFVAESPSAKPYRGPLQ